MVAGTGWNPWNTSPLLSTAALNSTVHTPSPKSVTTLKLMVVHILNKQKCTHYCGKYRMEPPGKPYPLYPQTSSVHNKINGRVHTTMAITEWNPRLPQMVAHTKQKCTHDSVKYRMESPKNPTPK